MVSPPRVSVELASCEKVIVVCGNLNTHTKGAFYEAFEAERARSLVRRIEFHNTRGVALVVLNNFAKRLLLGPVMSTRRSVASTGR